MRLHSLVILIALSTTATSQAQILIQTGLESWAFGLPDGLVGSQTTLPLDSISEVTSPVHSGTRAMRIGLGSDGGGRLTTGPLPVSDYGLYEVRFWALGQARVGIGLYDGRAENGGFAPNNPGVEVNSTSWQYVIQTVMALNTNSAAEFVFDLEPMGEASYLIMDDLTINGSALPEATVATINEIQTTSLSSGTSPLNFQFVRTQGIITGLAESSFFLQDGSGPWNGIEVFEAPQPNWALGDEVIVFGTVDEYTPGAEWARTRTRLIASPFLQRLTTGNAPPEPSTVDAWALSDEQWESVLVRVQDLTCLDVPNATTFEWPAANWQGSTAVDDLLHYFAPTVGATYTINGIAHYDGIVKMLPRGDEDISAGVGVEERSARSAKLYPNPASHHLTIEMKEDENAMIHINDPLGRTVLQTRTVDGRCVLDLGTIPQGAYIVVLYTPNEISIGPLIIDR